MNKIRRNHFPIAVTSASFSKNGILRGELDASFSDIKYNDKGLRLVGDELFNFLEDRAGAIIALEIISDDLLASLPHLKVISKYGVGINNLDLDAIKKHDIKLGLSFGVNKQSAAELTLSLMLGVSREVFSGISNLKSGKWLVQGGNQIAEKTIGIIGCGHIGKLMIDLLAPFNCSILVNDILDMSSYLKGKKAKLASKEQIYENAHIITIHIPYSNDVHHLIGMSELNQMKITSILINTSRGGIIDESALYDSLVNGSIRAAAVDVFEQEPPQDSKLLDLSNFFATPHIGGSASEAVMAMGRSAISNLILNINQISS